MMASLFKKYKSLDYIISAITIIVGTFIMSAGYSVFYIPNNINPGGFSGFAMVLSEAFFRLTKLTIDRGFLYVALNIPLYIIGYKNMGFRFFILSLIGTVSFSLMFDKINFAFEVSEPLLAALYGGVVAGFGLGLVVLVGASTGGSDMMANILNRKNPRLSVGNTITIINIFVLVCNTFLFGMLTALYGFIAIFLNGLICDYVVEGPKNVKAYYIITNQYEEISDRIFKDIKRGVTDFKGIGMYSRSEKNMLLCLVTRSQVNPLKKLVFDIDPTAFLFSMSVKEAVGNGFNKYTEPRKNKYSINSNIKAKKSWKKNGTGSNC